VGAADRLVDQVRRAAVAGADGGPTWLKLRHQAALVIANGVECQPLARADRAAMTRYPADVIRGLRLAMQAVRAEEGIVALREDMDDASAALSAEIAGDAWLQPRVRIVRVPAVYPAGEEGQLALHLTGRAAPAGGSPPDAGTLVLGVRTLLAINEAARDQAGTHQLVAVMGAVRKPATVWAPRGIALESLVAAAGGLGGPGAVSYFPGGPLQGVPADGAAPLEPGVGLLVVLPAGHAAARKHDLALGVHLKRGLAACESCEQCTRLCPAHLAGQPLAPHLVMRAIAHGLDAASVAIVGAAHCSGCGLCTAYSCPVDLAPSLVTLAVKRQLAAGGYSPPVRHTEPRAEWADRRIPLRRLLERLDLARYDVPAPIAGTVSTDRVLVRLELPSGLFAAPTVRDGHRVKAGQKVAEIPGTAEGAPVLASIGGAVSLTPHGIEIRA